MHTSITHENSRILSFDEEYHRVLAIGDIHGCARHLEKLLAAVQPTGDDLVITLGDYIDRGPDSKGAIDTLLRLHRNPEINIVSLRGNHDALMLMTLRPDFEAASRVTMSQIYYSTPRDIDVSGCDAETIKAWWLVTGKNPERLWGSNGSWATLSSYESADQSELIPEEHISFLRDICVDAVETDRFIFVHGGLCPDLPLADQPLFFLHWNRFDRRWPAHVSGKKVVCGHTPQPDLLVHDLGHAVCLDTGAYMAKGFLSCMDVLTGQTWQINDDLKIIQQPVVHYDNGVPYVRISELPEEEGERFSAWLMGHSAPFVEGEGDCAWPTDFNAWRCRRI